MRACSGSRRAATAARPAPSIVDRNTGREHFQRADVVILAANGVGTPRLLLASDNLANSSDQVGRNLLHHTLVACEIWVDEPIGRPYGLCRLADQPRVRRDRRQPRLRQRLQLQLPDERRRRRAGDRLSVRTRDAPWGAATITGSSAISATASASSRSATTCRIPTTASRCRRPSGTRTACRSPSCTTSPARTTSG